MKKRWICLILSISLLLSGCGISGKRYVSVTPHREDRQNAQSEAAVAADITDLMQVLEEMIHNGTENGVIYIPEFPANLVDSGMKVAVDYAMNDYPLGAYVVSEIRYEVGSNAGLPAMAVQIDYRHTDTEILQIRDIVQMEEAEPLVAAALRTYDARLVMRVKWYFERDFQQMVRDYAEANPDWVMEIPQVTVGIYGSGFDRVVELTFAYQNGRDSLRQMRSKVKPVFEAAELYVSGDALDRQKYSQLYGFLTERFDYKIETSITPAYSLLHHGVGDSRAFATVYAAMCRRAGLECMVVTGTRSGEPWVWNMIDVGGTYQHVDLLQCNALGKFQEHADRDMEGYVWDYSAYPECPVIRAPEPVRETASQPSARETEPEVKETVPETLPDVSEGVPEELPNPTVSQDFGA